MFILEQFVQSFEWYGYGEFVERNLNQSVEIGSF